MRAEIVIAGIVQGVGFRPFIYRLAMAHELRGWVQNRADAGVKIIAEGNKDKIESFLQKIKEDHPPLARIYDIRVRYEEGNSEFEDFSIYKSSSDVSDSGSVIPPDVSICNNCLKELQDPKDRRYNYFFITCTDCGPRFTAIERLPYDRPNTTMVDFPMCNDCYKEYNDPMNRRFHAQTVACPTCGPEVLLVNRGSSPRCNRCDSLPCSLDQLLKFEITAPCRDCYPNVFAITGQNVSRYKNPISEAGKMIQEGYIMAMKGNGGFHIAASTTNPEPLRRLREKKYRGNKPFAIMARDLEAVRSFAKVSQEEERLLTSYVKPIVLLKKSKDYYLSDLVAPGLDRIGVMLPYTGLHFMLFDSIKYSSFVMTSANPPNEPIITENREAMKKIGPFVDFFLIHNRRIAQRADDSVVRMHGNNMSITRRSRGFAPEPIHLKKIFSKKNILGIGAELNVTSCLLLGDKAIISQHIGDVEKYETLRFLEEATGHLIKLANAKIDLVACDLHPYFTTTKLASEFATKLGCPVIPVQHHHAHISSLMAEHGIDSMVGIACDGYGYGIDSMAWGGEVLYCKEGEFERVGHLANQPLAGGDLATRYPLRMVASILHKQDDTSEWLSKRSKHFPHGERELAILQKQLESGQVKTATSSCGRILDAVAALLDVCYERTYEGEPAMRLESVSTGGSDVLNINPRIHDDILDTSYLLREIYENLQNYSVRDLAFSAHTYIAQGLAEIAVKVSKQRQVNSIGLSGGVAHNEIITGIIRKVVSENDLNFYVHNLVPPGDGGISFGQACVAAQRIERNLLEENIISKARSCLT